MGKINVHWGSGAGAGGCRGAFRGQGQILNERLRNSLACGKKKFNAVYTKKK